MPCLLVALSESGSHEAAKRRTCCSTPQRPAEGERDGVAGVDTLARLEAQALGDQRRQFGRDVEPVEIAPVLTGDGQGVAATFGGDQRHGRRRP